jgi:hypothetical protein
MQPTLFPLDDPDELPVQPATPPLTPATTQAQAAAEKPRGLRLRGFTCPHCRGVRLFVYRTRRPCAGKIVRYRQCSVCGFRTTTEEKLGHALPGRDPSRVTAVLPT